MISIFDLFKIGIGPSSSHTVGPIKAAAAFAGRAAARTDTARVNVRLYGSLAWTGKGHETDRAVILGCSPASSPRRSIRMMPSRSSHVRARRIGWRWPAHGRSRSIPRRTSYSISRPRRRVIRTRSLSLPLIARTPSRSRSVGARSAAALWCPKPRSARPSRRPHQCPIRTHPAMRCCVSAVTRTYPSPGS